jgi:hypothetical protein
MTETVSDTPRQTRGERKPRLRIERVYTTPGVHPYAEVTWERRDVVMTNWRDGTVNFEQRDVEFPDFWSVNAANIVTTKYFRGAVGTPQRESTLRQLIDRVVLKYGAAGREHGYFANEDDAVLFEHELTWMLLHQVFSFNSPGLVQRRDDRAAAGQRLPAVRRPRQHAVRPDSDRQARRGRRRRHQGLRRPRLDARAGHQGERRQGGPASAHQGRPRAGCHR